jgi:DnaB-like helicase N terminal domain
MSGLLNKTPQEAAADLEATNNFAKSLLEAFKSLVRGFLPGTTITKKKPLEITSKRRKLRPQPERLANPNKPAKTGSQQKSDGDSHSESLHQRGRIYSLGVNKLTEADLQAIATIVNGQKGTKIVGNDDYIIRHNGKIVFETTMGEVTTHTRLSNEIYNQIVGLKAGISPSPTSAPVPSKSTKSDRVPSNLAAEIRYFATEGDSFVSPEEAKNLMKTYRQLTQGIVPEPNSNLAQPLEKSDIAVGVDGVDRAAISPELIGEIDNQPNRSIPLPGEIGQNHQQPDSTIIDVEAEEILPDSTIIDVEVERDPSFIILPHEKISKQLGQEIMQVATKLTADAYDRSKPIFQITRENLEAISDIHDGSYQPDPSTPITPHHIEELSDRRSEEQIISTMLQAPQVTDYLTKTGLTSKYFTHPEHQAIYTAAQELNRHQQQVNLLSVRNKLNQSEATTANNIVESTPVLPVNIHVGRVIELRQRRELLNVADMLGRVLPHSSTEDLLNVLTEVKTTIEQTAAKSLKLPELEIEERQTEPERSLQQHPSRGK